MSTLARLLVNHVRRYPWVNTVLLGEQSYVDAVRACNTRDMMLLVEPGYQFLPYRLRILGIAAEPISHYPDRHAQALLHALDGRSCLVESEIDGSYLLLDADSPDSIWAFKERVPCTVTPAPLPCENRDPEIP